MSASPVLPVMQDVEAEVDALLHRAGSQEQMAALVGCDQSQISRKSTRVQAGDATWLEVLRAGQLLALGLADERVRSAIVAAVESRRMPSGDGRALGGDIGAEIERSATLTQIWVKAMADGSLSRREIDELIVAADGLRETCDAIIRDARAQRARSE